MTAPLLSEDQVEAIVATLSPSGAAEYVETDADAIRDAIRQAVKLAGEEAIKICAEREKMARDLFEKEYGHAQAICAQNIAAAIRARL